eukprot:768482-Hanusia_phi.AAC.2
MHDFSEFGPAPYRADEPRAGQPAAPAGLGTRKHKENKMTGESWPPKQKLATGFMAPPNVGACEGC